MKCNIFVEKEIFMTKRLSSREVRLAKTLADGLNLFEAVRSFRTAGKKNKRQKSRGNNYADALQALRNLAEDENIPIAVIGGVAAVYHGYERFTEDMDIVVSAQDFDRIVKVCYKYGFDIVSYNPTGMHVLSYGGFKIEVLEEGMFASDVNNPKAMPSPAELGVTHGLQFVPLEKWVRLKLSGDRAKDNADIVEVLKKKSLEEHQDTEDYLMNFNPGYAERFRQLAKDAEKEKQQESLLLKSSQTVGVG
jgi:hypothetical protein